MNGRQSNALLKDSNIHVSDVDGTTTEDDQPMLSAKPESTKTIQTTAIVDTLESITDTPKEIDEDDEIT